MYSGVSTVDSYSLTEDTNFKHMSRVTRKKQPLYEQRTPLRRRTITTGGCATSLNVTSHDLMVGLSFWWVCAWEVMSWLSDDDWRVCDITEIWQKDVVDGHNFELGILHLCSQIPQMLASRMIWQNVRPKKIRWTYLPNTRDQERTIAIYTTDSRDRWRQIRAYTWWPP